MNTTIRNTCSMCVLCCSLQVQAQTSSDPKGTASTVHEAFPYRPQIPQRDGAAPQPVSFESEDAYQEGQNIHSWPEVTVEEISRIEQEFNERYPDTHTRPQRNGWVRQAEASSIKLSRSTAHYAETPAGEAIWTIAVRSPDAFGMRVHFSQFDIGRGSLLLFSQGRDRLIVRGPFTMQGPKRTGEFWSPSLPGDTVYLEIVGCATPQIEISAIVHRDVDANHADCSYNDNESVNAGVDHPFQVNVTPRAPSEDCCKVHDFPGCDMVDGKPNSAIEPCVCAIDPFCCQVEWNITCVNLVEDFGCGDCPTCEGKSLPCHEDVMCWSSIVDSAARDAVGVIGFIDSGSLFACNCSGTLLNDLDDATVVPYFLTAYHCLHTQAQVDDSEVVWGWQRDECGGLVPDFYDLESNLGGTLLATNDTDDGNDMSFIRLNGSVQPGVALAGWTTEDIDDGYGIHHPAGDLKSFVWLDDEDECPFCDACGDLFDYDYFTMEIGLTEGGSSGSGLFNIDGQLNGQLRGRCCVVPACADGEFLCEDVDEYNSYYGEFEETYPQISYWLSLGGTIWVSQGDFGYEDGTMFFPFNTITEAHNLAWDGVQLNVWAGNYPESLTITKAITINAIGGTVRIGD